MSQFRRFLTRPVARLLTVMTMMSMLCMLATPAMAAAPKAGTSIGNQSTATYTDGSGIDRTATSNPVYTTVTQVPSVTLEPDVTKPASAGSPVVFPHKLTNTGNGPDTFNLTFAQLAGDSFDFAGAPAVLFYSDQDKNGVADNTTPITSTGELAAGAEFYFVAVAVVPTTAANSDYGRFTVTATTTFPGYSSSATVTDRANVTTNAVVNVTKAISQSSGVSSATGSGPYTYTLTYSNSGNAAATTLKITDAIPAKMVYVAGSGRWSGSASALTDDTTAADPVGITYDYDVTTAGTITAIIANVAPGATGTLRFQVNVLADQLAGVVNNTAYFEYNDGASSVGGTPTNTVPFTILQDADVALTGDTVATANQGTAVTFTNTLTNTGNAPDIFNVTVTGNTFPAGTTFLLYQADGSTPLMNTNDDGIPDTGLLAPGATYNVILKAILPPGAGSSTPNGPYTVTKRATSVADPTEFAEATDSLTTITPATVDLTNNKSIAGGAEVSDGLGATGTTVINTNTVAPGTTTRFTLYVNNTSAIGDTYTLQASTNSTFGTLALPANWTVTFRNATEGVITNTGIVSAMSSVLVYADVYVPANAVPADSTTLYFRAISPTTGASDIKADAVSVTTVRSITLEQNNEGQIYAGNSKVYTHVITNTGNVLEGDGTGSVVALTTTNSGAGFTSAIYWDKNNNGSLDATDPIISSLAALTGGTNGASTVAGLAPGESARLFVKVYAPVGAAAGATDQAILTATITGVIGGLAAPAAVSNTDKSIVVAGDLFVEKWQALDANGDGTPEGAYTQANIAARPGACVRYKIVVTNNGTAEATNVVVSDSTPTYTVYDNGDGLATGTTGVAVWEKDGVFTAATAPADGAAGAIVATVGTLAPHESVTLYFGVKINQ